MGNRGKGQVSDGRFLSLGVCTEATEQTDRCCWSVHRRAAAGARAQPRYSLAQPPGSPAPSPCHHHSPGGRGDLRAFRRGAAAPGRQGATAAAPPHPRRPGNKCRALIGRAPAGSAAIGPRAPIRASPHGAATGALREQDSQSERRAPRQQLGTTNHRPRPRLLSETAKTSREGGRGERWAGPEGCSANRERGRAVGPVPVRSRFDPSSIRVRFLCDPGSIPVRHPPGPWSRPRWSSWPRRSW